MATEDSNPHASPILNDEKVDTTLGSANNEKTQAIIEACSRKDLEGLRSLASSTGGFLTDDLRRTAWPILLECNEYQSNSDQEWNALPIHKDEEQVQKDVDRAFVYYPDGESKSEAIHRKKLLYDLIVRILRTYPMLHYFQGYHDIIQVLLLVCGTNNAYEPASRISLLHIRDYMLPALSPATQQLELIPAIVRSTDPILADHLAAIPPYFALSSTLTLYAHDIEQYNEIARVFDFLLSHEAVMTLYLFASMILSRRDVLLEIPPEDPDMLFYTLSKLTQAIDLEALISVALDLYNKHPPEKLPGRVWASLSKYSVLKTSRTRGFGSEDMKEAEVLFNKHAQQLKNQENLHEMKLQLVKHKTPVLTITLGLFFGCLSWWLRKSGHDRMVWSYTIQMAGVLRRSISS